MMITVDQAVLQLRADPRMSNLVRDAYLDRDVISAGERFLNSAEFAEVRKLLACRWENATLVDLGAGTGIASYAFALSGARQVFAIEPDPSDEVGCGAISRLAHQLPIVIISAFGEHLPLTENSVDIVYARQVLHHIPNLTAALRECARILKPGGLFFACREHVISNDSQKQVFLRDHVMHQLAGNENAYTYAEYSQSIYESGLHLEKVFHPWDTVINAFPEVRSTEEMEAIHQIWLTRKFGRIGAIVSSAPAMSKLVRLRFNHRNRPGRLYSFLAIKPD
jgi:ubiquinone/menaquinone biosynthesis C-methylase UbiE